MVWREENNFLVKEFNFKNFKQALDFTNKIGQIAEEMDHHPDIKLSYGRVEVSLTTHSEGKITQKDHNLASKIDTIAQNSQ